MLTKLQTQQQWIQTTQLKCLDLLEHLSDCFKKTVKFSPEYRVWGQIFDWEEHYKLIESIVKNNPIVEDLNKARQEYAENWRLKEFENAVRQWNKAMNRFGLNKQMALFKLQFQLIKYVLFTLVEEGELKTTYEKNKQLYKRKYKRNLRLHNEILRCFLCEDSLYNNLNDLVNMAMRMEEGGGAEGKVEGEINKLKRRYRNRLRLSACIFGMEHTITEVLVELKDKKQKIINRSIDTWEKKNGVPLYKDLLNASYHPSKPVHEWLKDIKLCGLSQKRLKKIISDKNIMDTKKQIENIIVCNVCLQYMLQQLSFSFLE